MYYLWAIHIMLFFLNPLSYSEIVFMSVEETAR